MEHTPENLDKLTTSQPGNEPQQEEKGTYTPRPLADRILSWILIAVVLFGFIGTCYWLAFY